MLLSQNEQFGLFLALNSRTNGGARPLTIFYSIIASRTKALGSRMARKMLRPTMLGYECCAA